jgi:hypothetical protein
LLFNIKQAEFELCSVSDLPLCLGVQRGPSSCQTIFFTMDFAYVVQVRVKITLLNYFQ